MRRRKVPVQYWGGSDYNSDGCDYHFDGRDRIYLVRKGRRFAEGCAIGLVARANAVIVQEKMPKGWLYFVWPLTVPLRLENAAGITRTRALAMEELVRISTTESTQDPWWEIPRVDPERRGVDPSLPEILGAKGRFVPVSYGVSVYGVYDCLEEEQCSHSRYEEGPQCGHVYFYDRADTARRIATDLNHWAASGGTASHFEL